MWNWQRSNWPQFRFQSTELKQLENKFLQTSGELIGAFKHLDDAEKELLKIELISEEAFKTSEIEGEILDRDSLQSSIRRQFGLSTDKKKIPLAEAGIAEMMVSLYHSFQKPLTKKQICNWHQMLMSGRKDLQKIGAYRIHKDPMQVVSGRIDKPTVHFEAPPSSQLTTQMKQFISWFNETGPKGGTPLSFLTRASIAHLYFVCIHPFEDGNGRIGRAIAEKALAQNLGQPTLIALAYSIEKNKKDYYAILEKSNKALEITPWLIYFSNTILEAQKNTQKRIEFLINKAKFYDRLEKDLNKRQLKALARMFEEGIEGFKGGLSAKKYMAICKAPPTTATRDLQDLVLKGALFKTGEHKQTRYFLNMAPFKG